MKLAPLAGLAALIAVGAGSAALAQSQYDPNDQAPGYAPNNYPPGDNPNVQAYRNYQGQRNVYDNQVDAYANQRDAYDNQRGAYDQNAAGYRSDRRAYQRQMRDYERARADYDAQYGPGAYERYYAAPIDRDYDGPD